MSRSVADREKGLWAMGVAQNVPIRCRSGKPPLTPLGGGGLKCPSPLQIGKRALWPMGVAQNVPIRCR